MSLRTSNTEDALEYAKRKIGADHSLVLIVFDNGDNDMIITPIDSDSPGDDFKLIGTIYWNDNDENVEFKGTSVLD